MIHEMYDYLFDFKNMWFYGSFKLRIRYCSVGPSIGTTSSLGKPDMDLIHFQEMRFIGGKLKHWDIDDKAWIPIFPQNEKLNQELTNKYIEYCFENQILK